MESKAVVFFSVAHLEIPSIFQLTQHPQPPRKPSCRPCRRFLRGGFQAAQSRIETMVDDGDQPHETGYPPNHILKGRHFFK